jgi:hypothetical protein
MFFRIWQGTKNLMGLSSEEKSDAINDEDAPPQPAPTSSMIDVVKKLGMLSAEDLADRQITAKSKYSLPNDKKLENMVVKEKLEHENASGSFSHVTLQLHKKDKEDIWFAKWIFADDDPNVNRAVAEREVCVMSKGVKGFLPCHEDTYNLEYIAQTYTEMRLSCGAGELLVSAMIAHEVDLRLPNIGFGENGLLNKIDGDRCFAIFWNKGIAPAVITSSDLNNLPFVADYKPTNWFTLILSEKMTSESLIPSAAFDLSHNPLFRREVNRGILKNLLLSDDLLHHFFKNYVSDATHCDALEKDIIDRREQLFLAGLQNDSFQQYLKSPDAKEDLQQFKNQLSEFKTTGKNFLLTENNKADILLTLDKRFNELSKRVNAKNAPTKMTDTVNQNTLRK